MARPSLITFVLAVAAVAATGCSASQPGPIETTHAVRPHTVTVTVTPAPTPTVTVTVTASSSATRASASTRARASTASPTPERASNTTRAAAVPHGVASQYAAAASGFDRDVRQLHQLDASGDIVNADWTSLCGRAAVDGSVLARFLVGSEWPAGIAAPATALGHLVIDALANYRDCEQQASLYLIREAVETAPNVSGAEAAMRSALDLH